MEEIISALIKQAFSAQDERINTIREENEKNKAKIEELNVQITDLKTLNTLLDEHIQKLEVMLKKYVPNEEKEFDLMEDYQFGKQE